MKIMFNDKYCLTEASLEGRKTMTRRVASKASLQNPHVEYYYGELSLWDGCKLVAVPRYKIGQSITVAQSYKNCIDLILSKEIFSEDRRALRKKLEESKGWANKMFTRAILLPNQIRITDIKVERLQEISDEDCMKEGVIIEHPDDRYYRYGYTHSNRNYHTPQEAFAVLIDKVSGKGTWSANPYVFVYSFELVK